MIRFLRALLLPLVLAVFLSACASTGSLSVPGEARSIEQVRAILPHIDREFRAVWVATVANIDWPSEPGLPTHQQQSELIDILDRVRMLGLNAVILQIRPTADALYESDLEPWSYYLTGQNGVAPDPAYDPLAFAVEESHRRGLDLHVWFNPYRAGHPTAPDTLAANHVTNRFPDAVHAYGTQRWMDPGAPEIADHSFAVVMDVVERYD
ncbi:MAG: glycoside hydrolase family 10 protein, partial [Rhodothermales bacterium]